jgi:cation diffusion facilitator family transporter
VGSKDNASAYPDRSVAERAAKSGAIAAGGLVILKLVTGIATGSLGMLAEAAHSLSDVGSSLVALWAIKLANQPPDRDHPFGHGKVEHLTALGESIALVIVGAGIGVLAISRILSGAPGPDHAGVAIVVACIVIVVDIWRYTSAKRAAIQDSSAALHASAIHFGSDMLGSLAVLVGLVLVALGQPQGDSFAALVVAVIVIVVAVQLGWSNVHELMDRVPAEAELAARRAVHSLGDEVELRRLRIRRAAFHYLADVVVAAPGVEHINQAHRLADAVEEAIQAALPGSDVVVHVEPGEPGSGIRSQVLSVAQSIPGVHEVHNVRVVDLDGSLEIAMHLKFPAHWSLQAAHEVASRVEREIGRAIPTATRVTTHLEPVSDTVKQGHQLAEDLLHDDIKRIIAQVAGNQPTDIRVHQTDDRTTALVTIACPADHSLHDAHDLATRVEAAICEAHPTIDEVVVHAEPESMLPSGSTAD